MIPLLQLAQLADKSYHEAPIFSKDVACRVDQFGDEIVVTCRGTDPFDFLAFIEDVLRDIDAEAVERPGMGLVHKGFINGAERLEPMISFPASPKQVTLNGHSLGGALALGLAATWILSKKVPVTRVVTFGAPRMGRAQFVALFRDTPVWQLHNGNDPVPSVPWAPFLHVVEPPTPIGFPQKISVLCHRCTEYVRTLTENPVD